MKRVAIRFLLAAGFLAVCLLLADWLFFGASEEQWIAARIREFNTEKAYAAAEAVMHLGGRVVPQLAEALDHPDAEIRSGAAHVLGQLGPVAQPAVPGLRQRLSDESVRVRATAAEALGRIGADDEETLWSLYQTLLTEPPEVHMIAGLSLGRIGPAAKPYLLAALAQESPDVRASAAQGLGYFRAAGKDVVPDLIALLADPEPLPRLRAGEALGRIGPEASPAVPSLLRLLAAAREGDDAVLLIEALGGIGPAAQEAIAPLLVYLIDPRESLRMAAATALSKIADDKSTAVPALEKMAQGDESPNVRLTATTALETIRSR